MFAALRIFWLYIIMMIYGDVLQQEKLHYREPWLCAGEETQYKASVTINSHFLCNILGLTEGPPCVADDKFLRTTYVLLVI